MVQPYRRICAGWCNGSMTVSTSVDAGSTPAPAPIFFRGGFVAVVQQFEVAYPLYTISCYRDHLFRVVKRCFTPSSLPRSKNAESQSYEVKLSSALYRARTMVREYALCNDWPIFGTLTFDKLQIDRYDLRLILKTLMKWLDNMRQTKYPGLRYLLVPEPHKDGAWHLHGFFDGIPLSPLPSWAPRDLLEGGYDEWTDYRLRFGWCSFAYVRSVEACGFYITKYITKNLAHSAVPVGIHLYYHSRGLQKSMRVGYRYSASPLLERCLKYKSAYWETAFFRTSDVGVDFTDVTGLCEEFDDMYKSWMLDDPVSGQPIVIAGGDDSDASLQMVLDFFRSRDPESLRLPPDSACQCGGPARGAAVGQ